MYYVVGARYLKRGNINYRVRFYLNDDFGGWLSEADGYRPKDATLFASREEASDFVTNRGLTYGLQDVQIRKLR
jgi:hypothetical protein